MNSGGDLGKRYVRQVGVLATCDCPARPSGRPLMINSVSRRGHRQILLATFSRPKTAFPQLIPLFQATRRRNLGLVNAARFRSGRPKRFSTSSFGEPILTLVTLLNSTTPIPRSARRITRGCLKIRPSDRLLRRTLQCSSGPATTQVPHSPDASRVTVIEHESRDSVARMWHARPWPVGPSPYHLEAWRSVAVDAAGEHARTGRSWPGWLGAVAALSCCTRSLRPEARQASSGAPANRNARHPDTTAQTVSVVSACHRPD
jgi:hypothetical protein